LRDTEEEGKELKDKLAELEDVLRQSEAHRQELDQELLKKDQQVAALLDAQTKAGEAGIKHYIQKMSGLAKRRQSSAENPSGDSDSGADGYPYSLRKASSVSAVLDLVTFVS
jgi:chromosome segregation ATPase